MRKKTLKLTESELIGLIKETISEIEMDTQSNPSKEPSNKVSFEEFLSIVKTGTDQNFEGKYKVENGRFYVKMPLAYNPSLLPIKDWVEIIIK